MMAIQYPAHEAASLDVFLASVPNLPRAILARLTARMIERLDELDGDPDDEPDEDRCDAGDDEMTSGNAPGFRSYPRPLIGNEDDAEPQHCAVQNRDQSPRPPIGCDNSKRKRRPAAAQSISSIGTLILIGRR